MGIKNKVLVIYFKHFKGRKNNFAINALYYMAKYIDQKYMGVKLLLVKKEIMRIKPDISVIDMSIISNCNLRCNGCLYGRDYMPQKKLGIGLIKRTIDDVSALNIPKIHFYGGEPLLHSDIIEMVAYASKKNVFSTLGTNGTILTQEITNELYSAGLRHIAISVYGVDEEYNNYVGCSDKFEKLDSNIKYIKCTYPDVEITFSWLLMKPTCNLTSLCRMLDFSLKHGIPFDVNLVHYDFPYFSEGDDGKLQFYSEDKEAIDVFVAELLRLKLEYPDLVLNSLEGIRSIPDWLIKKENMKIPCIRYQRLWIGPNGVVRVCQKSADLGNLNNSGLSELIYNRTHNEEAQNCFDLKCSNCHVGYDQRILQHSESNI